MKLFLSASLVVVFGLKSFAGQDDLDHIVKSSGINRDHLAIFIGQQEAQPTFTLNPQKKMIPASITKVVTSAMVLQQIPPGTKVKTLLMSDAKVQGKSLMGHLYVKGAGDPSFVSENMWVLVNTFTRNKIEKINGDLIIDDSLFDNSRFDDSREDVRVDRAYDAPTGAASFNWNSVNVFVRPGNKSGEPAIVFADPENSYIQLNNQVRTSSGDSHNVTVERKAGKEDHEDQVVVTGKIGEDSDETVVYKNITRPDLWFGYNLKSFLAQRGITVTGKIRNGKTPDKARVLAEAESKPIEHMMADMNKFSNNYVAEMLSKLAASKTQTPGTIPQAMKLIQSYMAGLGIDKQEYNIVNPSGFTRDNEITAHALWRVLFELKNQFQYQPEFLQSLPIAGIDGTLKKRMKNSPAERWVRAKTGFLTGVVSLAGYIGKKDGTVTPFVMMFNGGEDETKVRALYDKLCLALVE